MICKIIVNPVFLIFILPPCKSFTVSSVTTAVPNRNQLILALYMIFSNSLIIQKPKAKENMHRDVFGYLMKNSSFFASLISPSKSVCLRSYSEHSSKCFIAISKTSKFVKNTPLCVVFSTLFSVFDM